jgi:hypothetical protein
MFRTIRVTVATVAIGLAALLLTAPAQAGNGSAVGAGLAGLGIGAMVGSALKTRLGKSSSPGLL